MSDEFQVTKRTQAATVSSHTTVLTWGSELIDRKVTDARANHRGRECHLFHGSREDPSQRMLNALQPGTYIRPHRHHPPAGSESLVVLRGAVGVVVFEDDGTVRDEALAVLGPRRVTLGIDLRAGVWHTVAALETDTVFFEAKAGPYDPAATDFAPWAPAEGSPEAAEYLDRLVARFRHRVS